MNTKALRQKILDLAIRGKLVPQDPNDEPASVLLERIRAEKQQMVKDGKLKAKDIKNDTVIFLGDDNLHYEKFPDGTVKCIEDEIPFELPEGWEWCRLSTISQYISDGDHQPPPQTDDGIPFLVISNVSNGFLDFTSTRYVSPDYYNGIAEYRKPCKGDLLFTVTGSYGIPVLVNENKPFCFQRHIAIIRPIIISNSFLSYELGTSYIKTICDNQSTGTAQKTVGLATLRSFILPIPPITEQQRIESKIKELLLLTDNIESDKTDLQTTIQLTKSKILDLAIKGKLVPQNPDDEPASVLLDRIRAEKEELIKQGKIKRDKKESVIYKGDDNSYYEKIGDTVTCIDEELPFELPKGWTWVRLQTCCQKEIKRGKSPKYTESSGTLVFAQKCNTKYDGINMDLALYLDESTLVKYPDDEYMQDKDTVINSTGTGTLGRVGIYRRTDNRREMPVVPDSHVTVIRANNGISAEYIYHFLKAYQQELEKLGEGSTNQKELKQLTLKNLIVALPPYAEQERIIEIITAAFEIMTNIEKSLN